MQRSRKQLRNEVSSRSRSAAVVIVWEFHVRPKRRRAFEKAYGPQGAWAKLFESGAGYIRTDLMRDLSSPNRYLTLDYWESRRQYEKFRNNNQSKYLAIDERCAALTTKEKEIGWFTVKL